MRFMSNVMALEAAGHNFCSDLMFFYGQWFSGGLRSSFNAPVRPVRDVFSRVCDVP